MLRVSKSPRTSLLHTEAQSGLMDFSVFLPALTSHSGNLITPHRTSADERALGQLVILVLVCFVQTNMSHHFLIENPVDLSTLLTRPSSCGPLVIL